MQMMYPSRGSGRVADDVFDGFAVVIAKLPYSGFHLVLVVLTSLILNPGTKVVTPSPSLSQGQLRRGAVSDLTTT